jgi:hypothetical protein
MGGQVKPPALPPWTHHDEIHWLRTVLAESDILRINRQRQLAGLPEWTRLDMLRTYLSNLLTRSLGPGFHRQPVVDEISAMIRQAALQERGCLR